MDTGSGILKIIKEIDLFGKEPDIYYKGKQKKTTWMGRICTFIYIAFYIFFFIYKLIRMFNRTDVSFSEINSSEPAKMTITKDSFTFGIALADANNNPIIDDEIYSPMIIMNSKVTVGDKPVSDTIELGCDFCNKDDFGEDFQQYLGKLNLTQYYCLKHDNTKNIYLEGYPSADNYSSITIMINYCLGYTRDGRPCKDPETIKQRLIGANLIIFTQDFDLTPYDFKKPVKPKVTINSVPIRLDQVQAFVGYYQMTNINTEHNLFGFEALSNIKTQSYLLYHSTLIMSYEKSYMEYCVVMAIFTLFEKTLTNQRIYTQFIDVLGDVGGLMEVIESVFGVICILLVDILYDKTMVNNLFSFNLEHHIIRIKQNNNNIMKCHTINMNSIKEQSDIKIFDLIPNSSIKTNEPNLTKSILNLKLNDIPNKNNNNKKESSNNDNYSKDIKENDNNNKDNVDNDNNNIKNSERVIIKKNKVKKIKKRKTVQPIKPDIKNFDGNDLFQKDNKIFEKEIENDNKITEKTNKIVNRTKYIKKIDMNIFCTYFCFCCVRKRQNFGNVLLDEAMLIIKDKLDIYNMFRNFYFIDDLKVKCNYEYKEFEMTIDCKNRLDKISSNIYNSFYQI